MSRAAWQQLLTDRLFVAVVLVAHLGGATIETFHSDVLVAVFSKHSAHGLGERV